jgi:hypothetical protein
MMRFAAANASYDHVHLQMNAANECGIGKL